MSLFSKSDYARENKGKNTLKKIKLPTQSKTHYWFCRNCNCKNKDSDVVCRQCEKSQPINKMRRPYN